MNGFGACNLWVQRPNPKTNVKMKEKKRKIATKPRNPREKERKEEEKKKGEPKLRNLVKRNEKK